MNISYKIRVQQPLALPEWCSRLSLGAWVPSQAPPFQNVEVMPWLSGAHWALSRVLSASPGSGQEVLLSSESELLICFWQQLTSVTGFDSIGTVCPVSQLTSKGHEKKRERARERVRNNLCLSFTPKRLIMWPNIEFYLCLCVYSSAANLYPVGTRCQYGRGEMPVKVLACLLR